MNIQAILKAVLFTPGPKGRWGLPIIFEGKPGTGKTSIIEEAARSFGLHAGGNATIIGSIREPTDIGGLARLHEDHFRHVPAGWAFDLAKSTPHAVVLLDELNTNVPAMQAALLRLLTDGAVGEFFLPTTVRFLAAMNSTADAAGGWDLAPPLANRFGHMAWEPLEVATWTNWLLGGMQVQAPSMEAAQRLGAGTDPRALEAQVLKAFDEPFAKAKGLVSAFLRAKPSLMHKQPPSGSPEASRAWPSPRTWELATRAIAGAEVHGLNEIDSQELLAAFIGIGAAAELLQYQSEADLPDPSDVLDEKVTFKHNPKRLDRTSAVLSSCAALIAPDKAPKRKERADVLWRIIAEVAKDAADVTVQAAVVLATKGFISGKDAVATLNKLQPILSASNFVHKKEG